MDILETGGGTYFGINFWLLLIYFRDWLVGGVFGSSVPNYLIF